MFYILTPNVTFTDKSQTYTPHVILTERVWFTLLIAFKQISHSNTHQDLTTIPIRKRQDYVYVTEEYLTGGYQLLKPKLTKLHSAIWSR